MFINTFPDQRCDRYRFWERKHVGWVSVKPAARLPTPASQMTLESQKQSRARILVWEPCGTPAACAWGWGWASQRAQASQLQRFVFLLSGGLRVPFLSP